MIDCGCSASHIARRIVLTGGPGAGKTAVLELLKKSLCKHITVLPEAASIVFGGGFPRTLGLEARRAAQRAIFCVQRELEVVSDATDIAIVLCDRGTLDGAAYWPGPGELWDAVGATLEAELARYDAVIHLRTPTEENGYDHSNPLRIENAAQAQAIDDRIAAVWAQHPRRFEIPSMPEFLTKATRTLELLRGELPDCCKGHVTLASG